MCSRYLSLFIVIDLELQGFIVIIVVAKGGPLISFSKSLNSKQQKWQEIGLYFATGFAKLYIVYI